LNGTQLRNYSISGPGNGSLTIEGGSLPAGSYLYTLIVDGKEAATRKMMLVK